MRASGMDGVICGACRRREMVEAAHLRVFMVSMDTLEDTAPSVRRRRHGGGRSGHSSDAGGSWCLYDPECGAGDSGTSRARRNASFGHMHARVHSRRYRERDARLSTGKWSTGLLPPAGPSVHPVARGSSSAFFSGWGQTRRGEPNRIT